MTKILVADDNTNIQKMVALAFEERGIEVISVGNGEAAVRRLPDLNPDLILADIFMPVRNGYELCEWVKKDARFSQIPVILLVGAFDPLDEKEARRVGADGILKKPFVPPDPLIAMVTSVLEKNPKFAVDLAETKKRIDDPPPPAPAKMSQHVEPKHVQPKEVPEFPEPSPEEESLVYAFGTAQRALDDAGAADALHEQDRLAAEAKKDSEEEFDGASTTRDWRRTARDFQIPEEASREPFASDGDLSAFPTESDTPVGHIAEDIPEKNQEPEKESRQEFALAPSLPVQAEPPAPVTAAGEGIRIESAQADQEREAESEPRGKEPTPNEVPAPGFAVAPEPKISSRPTHWMDLIASSSVDLPMGDWFAATVRSARKDPSDHAAVISPIQPILPEPVSPVSEVAQPQESSDSEPYTETAAGKDAESNSVARPGFLEKKIATVSFPLRNEGSPLEVRSLEAASGKSAEDERLFAPVATRPAEQHPPYPHNEPIHDAPLSELNSGASSDAEDQVVTEPPETFSLRKDPALVEPPAVRVTPDPLLVAAESDRPSQEYGKQELEVAAPYSFITQAPPESVMAESAVPEARSMPHSQPEGPSLKSSWGEFADRIPTAPPSNREALSEIPFLTPPDAFHPGTSASHMIVDQAAVEAVARRVVEILEPHLYELLSQDTLKPLIEHFLRNELSRKEN